MNPRNHSPSLPDRRKARRRERVLRTIAVLPSLATLGNLTCGLGAIYLCLLSVQAADADLEAQTLGSARLETMFPTFLTIAAYLVIGAMIFDGFDGRLARLARKTSEFGGQLDSLSDMVSFGVAPAFLVLCIAQPASYPNMPELSPLDRAYWRAEWVMAAVFVCCAALRLARFNAENEEDESAHMDFRGLPTPGAAGAIVGLVILHQGLLPDLEVRAFWVSLVAVLLPLFAVVLGLLMVSRFRYAHLVNALLRGRRSIWQVVALIAVVLVGLVVEFRLTLALGTAAYALSGPVAAGIYRALGKKQPREVLVSELDADMTEDEDVYDDSDEEEDDRPDAVSFTG